MTAEIYHFSDTKDARISTLVEKIEDIIYEYSAAHQLPVATVLGILELVKIDIMKNENVIRESEF